MLSKDIVSYIFSLLDLEVSLLYYHSLHIWLFGILSVCLATECLLCQFLVDLDRGLKTDAVAKRSYVREPLMPHSPILLHSSIYTPSMQVCDNN